MCGLVRKSDAAEGGRYHDALVELTAARGIAYVPYFPLGGFSPLQSGALASVAARLGASQQAVALAWLLRRSHPKIVDRWPHPSGVSGPL